MSSRTRIRDRRVVSASLLVMAVARVVSAQNTGITSFDPGTSTTTPGNPYAGSETYPTTVAGRVGLAAQTGGAVTLNGVLPSGGFVVTDSYSSSLSAQYVYTSNNSTPVLASPTFNTATGSFQSSAGFVSANYRFANTVGGVAGQSTRYAPGSTTLAGTDGYLYLPAVQDPVSGSDIVMGYQGTLARVNSTNTPDNTIYYAYNTSYTVGTTSTPYTYRSVTVPSVNSSYSSNSTPTGLNVNNQLLVQANRYIGVNTTGDTTNLGTDAFVFTPAVGTAATGTLAQVGLTGTNYYQYTSAVNTVVTAVGAANATAYQTTSSTPYALNNAGAVVGTSNRYEANTPTTISATAPQGTDAWVYSGATALGAGVTGGTAPVGTLQVGLVGTGGAALGGYYSVTTTAGTYETAAVNGISAAGVVTGTSTVFQNSSSGTSSYGNSVGQEAWQFRPTLVGGSGLTTATATGYGTTASGTYAQLGLTTPATATGMGYQTSGGLHSTTVSVVNAAGNAAGTSVRYASSASNSSSNSFGADAWYYNGSGTTLVTPSTATAGSGYSNYVRASDGYSNSTVLTTSMSAIGLVAGTQARYAPTGTAAEGNDVWAYSPVTNNTYVIASPAIVANDADFAADKGIAGPTEYFTSTVMSVSDNGLVIGTLTPSLGSAGGGATLGTFVYAWTQQAGTVILGSTTSTSNMVATLTLNGSSGTAYISTNNIYADAAGDIFGVGNSTSSSGSTEVFEFATAVPEPTSLALVALTLTPLARRRRRRSATPCGTSGAGPRQAGRSGTAPV